MTIISGGVILVGTKARFIISESSTITIANQRFTIGQMTADKLLLTWSERSNNLKERSENVRHEIKKRKAEALALTASHHTISSEH